MIFIGERIHIVSPRVKEAIEGRDAKTIQEMALRQVEAGAHYLDLNIGPSRKTGVDVMSWIVPVVQEVTKSPLSLDTTNAAAIEAGLNVIKNPAMINSTSAEKARMDVLLPLAARHNAELIALTMTEKGIPNDAEARANLACEIMMATAEAGIPNDRVYLDPLVLTVVTNQDTVYQTVEAIRFFRQLVDPAPKTVVGLSNVSNGAPNENRPLLNRIFLVMCMGAGLDAAIADPLDADLVNAARAVDARDTSTPVNRLLVAVADSVANMEDLDPGLVDQSDPDQASIFKTVQVLQNKVMYAHSYLRF